MCGTNFFLRLGGADPYVLAEVFGEHSYDIPLIRPPKIIVDAGAHIGAATVFFLNRYPNAKVVAFEPCSDNFWYLQRNLRKYGNRVEIVKAALWPSNERVAILRQRDWELGQLLGEIAHDPTV